jgi:hypothetical protein
MKSDLSRHREFSSQEISKILARYRSSGLGALRFAQEEGIPPGRMHYWIYQKGRGKPCQLSRPSVCPPRFQEVEVATVLPGVANWVAEVSLPCGIAVRFSNGATPQWIGAVVQMLQRPC